MRVLHVSQLFPPSIGGIEAVVWELVVSSVRQGEEADVLCSTTGNVSNTYNIGNSKIYQCGSLFKLASVYFSFSSLIRWVVLRKKYDIVHVHLPHPLANLWMFLLRTDCHVVLHWHSDIVRQKRLKKLYLPLQRWLLARADAIVVTSPVYAESSRDLKGFEKKITVIPIGINALKLASSDDLLKKIKESQPSKTIIFSLGRHVYYKGFSWLIKAMKQLPEKFVLLLGGTGPLSTDLQKLVEELKLSNRVFFVGKIPEEELGSYYAACDIFCLPSVERSEAFGVVQLESMSFGKPVVSTSIPGSGVGWVNKDNVSGRVVPPGDACALANAIQDLAAHPLSADCIIKYFKDNFSAERMVSQVLDLYRNVLNKNEK